MRSGKTKMSARTSERLNSTERTLETCQTSAIHFEGCKRVELSWHRKSRESFRLSGTFCLAIVCLALLWTESDAFESESVCHKSKSFAAVNRPNESDKSK